MLQNLEAAGSELIVFHHIPKTGGTSLINMLRGTVTRRQAVHYAPESDAFTYRNRATDLKYRTPPSIRRIVQKAMLPLGAPETMGQIINEESPVPAHVKMIEGHFFADRLGLLDSGRTILRLAIIRDPLERILSQYDHHIRSSGVAVFTASDPFTRSHVLIDEYLLAPENTNLQTRMLEGRGDYILGRTDQLEVIAAALGGVSVRHDNRGYNRTETEQLDPALAAEFVARNTADYDLFEAVRSSGISSDRVAYSDIWATPHYPARPSI